MDVGEVAMTDNLGLGIGGLQVLQEEVKGSLLGRGAGVGIMTLGIHAAFIADAYGMLVVMADM